MGGLDLPRVYVETDVPLITSVFLLIGASENVVTRGHSARKLWQNYATIDTIVNRSPFDYSTVFIDFKAKALLFFYRRLFL